MTKGESVNSCVVCIAETKRHDSWKGTWKKSEAENEEKKKKSKTGKRMVAPSPTQSVRLVPYFRSLISFHLFFPELFVPQVYPDICGEPFSALQSISIVVYGKRRAGC